MELQFTPYTPLLLLALILSIGTLTYAVMYIRRNRSEPVIVYFLCLQLAMVGWAGTYLLQLSSTTLAGKLFWQQLLWPIASALPLSWLLLVLAYVGYREQLTRETVLLLSSVNIVFFVLSLTNSQHDLLYVVSGTTTVDGFVRLQWEFGPWYYVQVAYSYSQTVVGLYLLSQQIRTTQGRYRIQALTLLVSILLPFLAHVGFMLQLGPHDGVDVAPITFIVVTLTYWYTIFRYRFLDLVPVARNTVIDRMRDGYVVLDTDDRIVDLNPAAKQLLGLGDDVTGQPARASIGDRHDLGEIPLDERMQDEIVVAGRHIEIRLSPLYDEGLIGRLLILRDITERRSVEKRYQALIEHSSDMIMVVEPDGTVGYTSPSVEQILGYDDQALVGDRAAELVHPADESDVAETFEQALAETGYRSRFEFRIRHADGSWRIHEAICRSLLDNPVIEGIVVNTRDITDRKRRERELERTNDRLEEFASLVSHDLRNPLNVTRGYLQVVSQAAATTDGSETDDDAIVIDGDEAVRVRESIAAMDESLDRMETIVDDVLAMARHGQTIGETESVSLEAVAEDAWATVETFDATLEAADRPIEADRTRLIQLFENLFRNAVEHGGHGVTVQVDGHGGGFYVEDDGPGIPEEQRESVLEPGYTTAEEGTGFGLGIVSEIVDAHGWQITVTDGETGGARFQFETEPRVDELGEAAASEA